MSAQKLLPPVAHPPLVGQFDADLNGACITVAWNEDEGITHVQIGGVWFWALDVMTQEALDALEASRSFDEPDYSPSGFDAAAAADAAACRYQRHLDSVASQ